jgi:hypothetical protein
MKMGTTIIVCTLIAIGSFFGGGEYRHYQDCKLPPKTVNEWHYQITDVNTKSITTSDSSAYAINIFKDGEMYKTLMLALKGGTNIFVLSTTNSNRPFKLDHPKSNK